MRILLAPALLVCAFSSVAAADTDAYLRVVPAGDHVVIRATITGAPMLSASSISMKDTDGAPVEASVVTPYRDGPEPAAIAFVYNGQEVYVGNEDHEPDGNARFTGILKSLERGIDTLGLETLLPVGSIATAIAYAAGARIEVPMGPTRTMTGASLGDQRHYRNIIGTDLVAGVELGLAELDKTSTPRRMLIVIGDGNDTNNDAGRSSLALLKKQAAQRGITVAAILYKGALSSEDSIINALTSDVRTIASTEAIPATLAGIMTRFANRYYVTFPGTKLDFDGKSHDLIVTVGHDELDPVAVTLPVMAKSSTWFTWWMQLALGTALVGLLVLGKLTFSKWASSTSRV